MQLQIKISYLNHFDHFDLIWRLGIHRMSARSVLWTGTGIFRCPVWRGVDRTIVPLFRLNLSYLYKTKTILSFTKENSV